MNIKDSYLHSGTHLVKNISFNADSGVVKVTITWALEGAENTVLDLPTVGGALFGSQTANYVFAAPNGSSGNPSFRALVAADIPDIGAGKITSGELSADRLPWALTTARGAVKVHTVDSTTNVTGKQYWVNRNANGELYVAVPWDTNTHYTAVPVLGASNATSNATTDTTNAATYLNIVENSAKSGGILITGAGGASVKAKSGLLTITSTWLAANSSQAGYVPKLASGGTALASSANDYILAFTYSSSGTLTPSWKKLPANAYLNNTYDVYNGTYSIKSKVGDTVTTVSDFTANQNDADDFTIIQGDNITLTSDTTNRTLTVAANAVNSTLSGVAPQLANGGTELEDSTNDYVLSFTYASSGTLVPSWKKLPAKAYTWRSIQNNLTSLNNTTDSLSAHQGYLLANGSARDNTKLPLAGGTMTGALKRYYGSASNDPMIALTSNNLAVWLWRINHGTSAITSTSGVYGFGLKYIGTGDGNNNNLVLYADNQTSTQVAAMTMNQDGTIKLAVTPNVNGTNVSLVGHKHAYTDLTGSTTTADQAIVSSGTADGWTLKTLGSNAFNSTAYVPIAGGTMTGVLHLKGSMYEDVANKGALDLANSDIYGVNSIKFADLSDAAAEGLQWYRDATHIDSLWVKSGVIYFTPNRAFGGTATNYTVYHSGNVPSNTKDLAGIVAKGVASRVYMTDSTGAPAWREYDTTVTESSDKLITSGAVYSAIASNVSGAVEYWGTVSAEADLIALTSAGKGDFVRVATSFSFTDASGASVTAHVGDVVYLTNDTPTTSSNWLVAHTEIDTDTWTAASTSAAGYIPKLVTGGAALASSTNDYVLSFVNGTNTTPVWRKLPANAYLNTWTAWAGATSSTNGTAGYMPAPGSTNYLKFLRGDGQWITLSESTHTHSVKINGSTKTIAASGGTAVDLGSYVKLDAGATEQTIKNSISSLANGSLEIWRATNSGYSMIGFANGTTKTKLGMLGFTATANKPIFRTTGGVDYLLAHAGNISDKAATISTTSTTLATIAGVDITALLPIAARGESSVTSGVVTPTDSGTTKFLREDGTWVEPSYTTNTDKTGIKLTTVSGTKKADATVIITDSSTGLSIAGGTNKFLIGDGTNYIEVPVTPSITNNVTGSGTSGSLVKWNGANSITNGPALSSAISTLTLSTKFLREDGTWQAPSYTTDLYVNLSKTTTSQFRGVVLGYNSNVTANTGVESTVTNVVYITDKLVVQPSTGSIISLGSGTFAGLTLSSGDINFKAANNLVWDDGTYRLRILLTDDSTTDTAVFTFQQSNNSGSAWTNLMTIKDNSKVIATTFVGALNGNADTATNLSKTDGRGYLYQSANTTTSYTGVGSVTAQTEIGLPYIGYDGSANTYGIYKDLFYLSGTTKCINTNVHGIRFAEVKTLDSITDDWDNSTTSGTSTSGGTTYSAGDGISINNGIISATRKEWYGTEVQFNALTSLDSNTTYYIIES